MASVTIQQAIAATRFGMGAQPGELSKIGSDPKGWLKSQTKPGNDSVITTAPTVGSVEYFQQMWAGIPSPTATSLGLSNPDIFPYDIAVRAQFAQTTSMSFRERMVEFWSNHFSISTKGCDQFIADAFEREAIRPNVMGKFEDLLIASSQHMLMINYLENTYSMGPNSTDGLKEQGGINENLAREIMELHTLGTNSGYTQDDVTTFAEAITGWTYSDQSHGTQPYAVFYFEPNYHEPGAKTIMGKTYAQDGIDQGLAILRDFANNPYTIVRICKKIATHFHSDTPPQSLTLRLIQAWRKSGGDLSVVCQALIDAPELWGPTQLKNKSANDFWISFWRALTPVWSFDSRIMFGYVQMGQAPFSAPSPAGYSDSSASWGSPGVLRQKIYVAQTIVLDMSSQFTIDPATLAQDVLGPLLTKTSRGLIQSAGNKNDAYTTMMMIPEFQRR